MSLLQTLLALVVLIYVLCMVVQFLQEGVKAALSTKAKTMEKVIREFMGNDLLTPEQIEAALKRRGFQSLAALEHFSKEDFRQLMDTIPFGPVQLPAISNVLGVANASIDVACYDAALRRPGAIRPGISEPQAVAGAGSPHPSRYLFRAIRPPEVDRLEK